MKLIQDEDKNKLIMVAAEILTSLLFLFFVRIYLLPHIFQFIVTVLHR